MSKLCQTILRRQATASLDNKTLKRSLAIYLQSYRNITASDIYGNYDSTQSAPPIPVTQKAESIRRNIHFSNTKCIQSDCSILGLFVQNLFSHIMLLDTHIACGCSTNASSSVNLEASRVIEPKRLLRVWVFSLQFLYWLKMAAGITCTLFYDVIASMWKQSNFKWLWVS